MTNMISQKLNLKWFTQIHLIKVPVPLFSYMGCRRSFSPRRHRRFLHLGCKTSWAGKRVWRLNVYRVHVFVHLVRTTSISYICAKTSATCCSSIWGPMWFMCTKCSIYTCLLHQEMASRSPVSQRWRHWSCSIWREVYMQRTCNEHLWFIWGKPSCAGPFLVSK